MAMGRRRDRAHTPGLWIATSDLPATGGHPFYRRLNQILDVHGKTCAVPLDLGATCYPGVDYEDAIALVPGGYRPGDIALNSDPYSGFLSTHSPDTNMWKPVFHEGEIIAFAAGPHQFVAGDVAGLCATLA